MVASFAEEKAKLQRGSNYSELSQKAKTGPLDSFRIMVTTSLYMAVIEAAERADITVGQLNCTHS